VKIIMHIKFVFQCDLCRVFEEQAPYGRNEENASKIQIYMQKSNGKPVLPPKYDRTALLMSCVERLSASPVCDVIRRCFGAMRRRAIAIEALRR
jgi:hypothetical protein